MINVINLTALIRILTDNGIISYSAFNLAFSHSALIGQVNDITSKTQYSRNIFIRYFSMT